MGSETEVDPLFNLVYYHKETGDKYLVKRITLMDYIILDLATNTKMPISRWSLNNSFKADKGNSKRQRKVRLNFENKKGGH